MTKWKTRCWAYEVEYKPLGDGFHGPLVEEVEAEAALAEAQARLKKLRRQACRLAPDCLDYEAYRDRGRS